MLADILLIIAAYLVGSISAAIVTCRAMGLPDPRERGSGNPGATNVLRLGGKKAAAATLAGDLLKGLVPVLFAKFAGAGGTVVALTAVAAFLGHLYPVFFRFQGGKGVATAFGAILALSPAVGACAFAVWVAMALVFRISSLAALTAAALSPVFLWLFNLPRPYVVAMAVMVVLLLWRHRSNIQRLMDGSESRLGSKKVN